MKKFLSSMLTAILVLSMSTVAFAATTDEEGNFVDESTITITKNYLNPNAGVSPAETLNFEIKADSVSDAAEGVTKENMPVPTVRTIAYAEGDAGKVVIADGTIDYVLTKDIVVDLPEYTSVGVYTYIINEKAGNYAGVTYYTSDIKLVVTVIQDQTDKIRVASVHTEGNNEAKSDKFDNVYESGSLTVNKQVTGNLGDQTKEFTVKVVFTAPDGEKVGAPIYCMDGTVDKTIAAGWTDSKEVEITVTHDETVTFTNIPEGVTYTVTENDYEADGYKTSYVFSDSNKKVDSGIEGENLDTVVITNDKTTEVDTGITLDSAPYMLMLVIAAAGIMFFMAKRRRYTED